MCQDTTWDQSDKEFEMAVEKLWVNLVFTTYQASPLGRRTSSEQQNLSRILL